MGLWPTLGNENRPALPLYNYAAWKGEGPAALWMSRDRDGVWPGTSVFEPENVSLPFPSRREG